MLFWLVVSGFPGVCLVGFSVFWVVCLIVFVGVCLAGFMWWVVSGFAGVCLVCFRFFGCVVI